MFYFTADCHFGHSNVIRFCNRPFFDAEEMDRCLLENWNSRVRPADTVYIIGDMFFRPQYDPEVILKKLHGRKHLVLGNHDPSWFNKDPERYGRFFETVTPLCEVSDGAHRLVCCHYPMMTWPHSGKENCYHIFGHIHNDREHTFWPLLASYERALNAGVDVNGFQPVTVREMIENRKQFLNTKQ